jgi:hypothetical protein
VHSPRSIKPTVLIVIHETGNKNLPSAMAEAQYSNRDGSGASFTFVTNRDGNIVQCLDPVTQTPWTNGDLNQPSARVQRILSQHPGHNFNEFCFMTCENVAYLNDAPITSKQKETLAQLVAWGHKVSGLPINRDTVLGHRDINSVTRWNCPVPGDLDKFLNGIIARAKEIVGGSLPDTSVEEDPAVIAELKAEIADLKEDKSRMWQRIKRMEARISSLNTQLQETADDAQQLEEANLTIGEKQALIRRLRDRVNHIKEIVEASALEVQNA